MSPFALSSLMSCMSFLRESTCLLRTSISSSLLLSRALSFSRILTSTSSWAGSLLCNSSFSRLHSSSMSLYIFKLLRLSISTFSSFSSNARFFSLSLDNFASSSSMWSLSCSKSFLSSIFLSLSIVPSISPLVTSPFSLFPFDFLPVSFSCSVALLICLLKPKEVLSS